MLCVGETRRTFTPSPKCIILQHPVILWTKKGMHKKHCVEGYYNNSMGFIGLNDMMTSS